jgi:mannose-binding lectin 1
VQEKDYSLIPPLETTDVGEIGNWTIRGTATNMKTCVRLTSPIQGAFGSICQRVPTLFKEWSAELEIRAFDPNENGKHGHGIWFFFTEEVCPEFALKFNGFAFWVNTSSTGEDGLSDVYFAKGNGTEIMLRDLKPVGRVNVRNEKKPLRVLISRRFDRLTVDSARNTIFERIVDEDVTGVPDYGYFSISAVTTRRVDNNDVVSMRVYSMSESDHPNKTRNYSEENRKFIENSKRIRRQLKKRRHQKMQSMLKYVEEAKNASKKLTAQEEIDMKEAIRVIDEAHKRSQVTITAEYLEQFITENVDSAVSQALAKIEMAQQKYQDTRQDIDELWSTLKRSLLDIAIEEKQQLAAIQEQVFEFAKSLNFSQINEGKVKNDLKSEASSLHDTSTTNYLMIISMVEITLYVIFFLYMRHKTDNFKKRD